MKDKMGVTLYQTKNCQLYAVRCGAGEIYAAAATQYLIDKYKVAAVLNYGVVGGCTDALHPGEICVVVKVAHLFACSYCSKLHVSPNQMA